MDRAFRQASVQGFAKSQAVLSIKAHGTCSVSGSHHVRLLGNHSKGDCFYWEKYPCCSRVLLSTFCLELVVQHHLGPLRWKGQTQESGEERRKEHWPLTTRCCYISPGLPSFNCFRRERKKISVLFKPCGFCS